MGTFDLLSINSPNPWYWIYGAMNDFPALEETLFPYFSIVGLTMAVVAGLAISVLGLQAFLAKVGISSTAAPSSEVETSLY